MRSLATCLLILSCSGESFELAIVTPPAHADAIAEIHLAVLRPGAAAPFHCDDLAYGRVDAEAAERSKDRELILRQERDAGLGDLDRDGLHLFEATAIDAQGRALLIGCAEADPLVDGVLQLQLEPTVDVEIIGDDVLGGVYGVAAAIPLRAQVSDAFGDPAEGVAAVWGTFWKNGVDESGASISSADGILLALPAAPDAPGPVALDLRVRWADEAPIRISGLLRTPAVVRPLEAALVDSALGRFGPSGEMGVAVLLVDGDGAFVRFCAGRELNCTEPRRLGFAGAGRLVTLPGSSTDEIVVVSAGSWFRLAPGQPPRSVAGEVGMEPKAAVLGGACGTSDRILVITAQGGELYNLEGHRSTEPSPLWHFDSVRLLSAGCVDTVDGTTARTFVLEDDNEEVFLVAQSEGRDYFAEWIAIGGVAGVGVRGEGPLLRAQLELDEFVVSRASLQIYEDELWVEALDADYTTAAPIAVAGADFDGDGLLDLAAILADYDPASGDIEHVLYAALDDKVDDNRISGEASLTDLSLCSEEDPKLYAADFDANGGDDLLIIDAGAGCGRPPRLIGLPF